MTPSNTAGGWEYLGLFLLALATLMLEILLTRIFSVTLWYHLAFVAVSIAMFGMTLGAVVVYLFPRWFARERAWANLTVSASLLGIAALWSVRAHLSMTIDTEALTSPLLQLSAAYLVIAVPFVFSGIAVAIALTQFPGAVSRLYAADLAGAAAGCILLILVLDAVGGPAAVVAVAAAAAAAALCFAVASRDRRPPGRTVAAAIAIGLAFAASYALAVRGSDPLSVRYAKGGRLSRPMFEKWNSYSRIAVEPGPRAPFGWGLSDAHQPEFQPLQLRMTIDASADTVLTQFDGNLAPLAYLKHDVTNIAHYVARGSVVVVGAGGGRDVLSGLVFDQPRVVAVEMNRAILEAVNKTFGKLTGHLDRHPRVQFVNDEARSYLERSRERFDLIQISLIDTWAATAAGAFVLSENTLYTTGAWRTFLARLSDRGLVSISRWYARPIPAEMYKLTALATVALREAGVADTRRHLIIVATPRKPGDPPDTPGVATLLASRSPFTDLDLEVLGEVARRTRFDIILSPRVAGDPAFASLADARQVDAFVTRFPQDISPPTDDRPFFFKMDDRLLSGLFVFVSVVAVGFILVPVCLRSRATALWTDLPAALSFAGIGVGFMLIEIAQLQRLILLLGHPTFSLSVVLFGLLVSSGLGSVTTQRLDRSSIRRACRWRLAALVAVLIMTGLLTPTLVGLFQPAATAIRLALALALVMPAGFFMGMALPMAMKMASWRREDLTPWLWAINGAASICATVLAVVISSTWGISAAWFAGVACYLVSGAAMMPDAMAIERAFGAGLHPHREELRERRSAGASSLG